MVQACSCGQMEFMAKKQLYVVMRFLRCCKYSFVIKRWCLGKHYDLKRKCNFNSVDNNIRTVVLTQQICFEFLKQQIHKAKLRKLCLLSENLMLTETSFRVLAPHQLIVYVGNLNRHYLQQVVVFLKFDALANRM